VRALQCSSSAELLSPSAATLAETRLLPRLLLLQSALLHVAPAVWEKQLRCEQAEALTSSLLDATALDSERIFNTAVPCLVLACARPFRALTFAQVLLDRVHGPGRLLRLAASREHHAELSQQLLAIVNSSDSPHALRSAGLGFVTHAFRAASPGTEESKAAGSPGELFFYTNDVHVLIDILLRLIHDASTDQVCTIN